MKKEQADEYRIRILSHTNTKISQVTISESQEQERETPRAKLKFKIYNNNKDIYIITRYTVLYTRQPGGEGLGRCMAVLCVIYTYVCTDLDLAAPAN